MINKKRLYLIAAVFSVAIIVAIIAENTGNAYRKDLAYKEYEASSRDQYTSFKNNILNEIKGRLNLTEVPDWRHQYHDNLKMTSSQFEGPQVHLERLVYNKKDFHVDSVNRYHDSRFITFDIHSLQFDPDDPQTGKPDIKIKIIPPKPYRQEYKPCLHEFFTRIDGGEDRIKPYTTYHKDVFRIQDSAIIIEKIAMDLWLCEFDVIVETVSWFHKKDTSADDAKREIANQRHHPFDIVLKIFPNVSPWYVNTGNAFDKKSDMAIGAIYCKGIKKWPKESARIGVLPDEIGTSLPLVKQDYYANLDNPDKLFQEEITSSTIWNKPVYAKITFSDIGSYRSLTARGDEKIHFSFIMPLLVRGSWDIRIPSSIIPEYIPVEPYRRSLGNMLLPKWSIGKWGKFASGFIYLFLAFALMVRIMPRVRKR